MSRGNVQMQQHCHCQAMGFSISYVFNVDAHLKMVRFDFGIEPF